MKTRAAIIADAVATEIAARTASDKRLEAAGLKRLAFTDYTDIPDQLEREIDAGRMFGMIALYRLAELEPGRTRIGSMQAGMTPREAFDTLCLIRRSMMTTLGFADDLEPDTPAPILKGTSHDADE